LLAQAPRDPRRLYVSSIQSCPGPRSGKWKGSGSTPSPYELGSCTRPVRRCWALLGGALGRAGAFDATIDATMMTRFLLLVAIDAHTRAVARHGQAHSGRWPALAPLTTKKNTSRRTPALRHRHRTLQFPRRVRRPWTSTWRFLPALTRRPRRKRGGEPLKPAGPPRCWESWSRTERPWTVEVQYLADVCACERKPISLAPAAAVRGVPAWLERWESPWQRFIRGLARPEVPAASCRVQISYAAVQGAPDYGLPRQH